MASVQVEHGTPEWHQLRRVNIGSSEVSSLFGKGFSTAFQLGAEKNGILSADDLSSNERVLIGSALEAGIAEAVRIKFDVKLRKVRRYITHATVDGMGASLDYEELTPDAGWVPAEIKNVDYLVFRDSWEKDEELGYIPPDGYLLQVQHQLACTGKPYCYVYALVGGNELHRIKIERSNELIGAIERAVEAFWRRQRAGEPQPVDYLEDRSALMSVHLDILRKEQDLSSDIELAALVQQYADVKRTADSATEELERIKSQIFLKVKDAEKVRACGASINCRLVPAKPARTVEYKASEARREMRIYLAKELKA